MYRLPIRKGYLLSGFRHHPLRHQWRLPPPPQVRSLSTGGMAHRMRETFTLMDRRVGAFCRRFSAPRNCHVAAFSTHSGVAHGNGGAATRCSDLLHHCGEWRTPIYGGVCGAASQKLAQPSAACMSPRHRRRRRRRHRHRHRYRHRRWCCHSRRKTLLECVGWSLATNRTGGQMSRVICRHASRWMCVTSPPVLR